MPGRKQLRLVTGIAGATILALTFPTAGLADITGGALVIHARTDAGDEATYRIDAPPGARSWAWSTNQTIEMRSDKTGNIVAVINPAGDLTFVEYVDDPVVTLGVAVSAGASPTTFVISSALLSFPTLAAEGRVTVGMTATDSDGDGVTLTGLSDPAGSLGAYLAQYNGFAGTVSGTTFAEEIQSMSAPAFTSDTQNRSVPVGPGFQAIGVPVNDMSVKIHFRLSANDQASVTSTYILQQRPVPAEATTWSRIKALTN